MKRQYIVTFGSGVATAALLAGCMDLNLLDEMVPADTGSEDVGASGATSSGADGAASGDSDGSDAPLLPDEGDTAAPAIRLPACGDDERVSGDFCIAEGPLSASIRFETEEPATVSLLFDEPAAGRVLSEPWERSHRGLVSGLPPMETRAVTVQLSDIAGNVSTYTASVQAKEGPPVSITEVSADPAGSEPDQEFVEIANYGESAIDLSGWMVDDNDDRNGDLLPEGTVLAGRETALLVPEGYRSDSGEDPAPIASTVLVFLDSAVGSNGLRNQDAEPVVLYDRDGTRVSRYSGRVHSPGEGVSVVRRCAEMPDGDPGAFMAEPGGTASPGYVDFLE